MKYITVIGLEVHCELNTKAKVFTASPNFYTDLPNSTVTPGDIAMPGYLPVLNKEALKKAIKMSMCLNCKIPDEVVFDRKNYFYPDLPSSLQITQDTKPIGVNGEVKVEVNGEEHTIKINNLHLEEDTASLDHYFDYSLIDYNRSAVPLIEIVTEPCMHDPETAVAFLEYLRSVLKYADISEADTKKGQIRCDVNISLMKEDAKEFGTRVEVKNINSFGNVYDAIIYEIKRQTELLESGRGHEIIQETRRFEDATSATYSMRAKETATDYRYYVEPNIPRFKLDQKWLKTIKNEIPLLPNERIALYQERYDLNHYDAGVIVKDKAYADYFESCLNLKIDPKKASNWLTTMIMGHINKFNLSLEDFYLTPERLGVIIKAVSDNQISSKQAKELFYKVIEEKEEPATLMKKYGMQQLDNDEELETIIQDILANNQAQINEYQAGKTNMFDYFVGQTMKATKGQANPVKVKDILNRELNK